VTKLPETKVELDELTEKLDMVKALHRGIDELLDSINSSSCKWRINIDDLKVSVEEKE
jgi:hypothetical protein